MGVKGFSKTFLPKRVVKLKDFSGKRIVIDASTEIYQASLGGKSIGTLTDPNGNPTMHINTIIARILEFHKYNIDQIWVFDHAEDGAEFHNPAKNNERMRRHLRKEDDKAKLKDIEERIMEVKEKVLFSDDEDDSPTNESKEQSMEHSKEQSMEHSKPLKEHLSEPFETKLDLDQIDDDKEVNNLLEMKQKLEKRTFTLNSNVVNEIKLIFNYLNIKYIEAPAGFEAESIASYLSSTDQCDAVYSNDTDPIPFGAKVHLRKHRDKKIYEYTRNDILRQINEISPKANINDIRKICVILGCDFCIEKTPKVGPKTVLKKFREIELTDEQKKAIEHYEKEPDEDIEVYNMDRRPFMGDTAGLIDWLVLEKGFNRKRMEEKFVFDAPKKTTKAKVDVKTKVDAKTNTKAKSKN